MPKASIRFYLVLMVCAIAVPVLAFVGLLLVQLQINERAALESRAEREAQLLGTGVSRVLQEMSTTLRLLVTSPELDVGDLKAFHNRAQAALRRGSLFVILVDADGQQRLNTRVPFGAPLGKTSNVPALDSVLESGRIEVSDVFLGATSGQWVFNVTLPLPQEQSSTGAALILTKNADELANLTLTEGLPEGWSAAVLDGAGRVVASSDKDLSHGVAFDEELPAHLVRASGVIYGAAQSDGKIIAYIKLRDWAWTTIVWGPVATAQASILTTWRHLIFGGIALLALAVALAIFLSRQLRISVRGIATMAEQVGAGHMVAPVRSQIVELDRVAKALSAASFERSQAEDQNRLMLRELAHRTKNMLAITQAMIHQTSRSSTSLEEFREVITERIAGLGRSTDLLTSEQWVGVPIKRLLEKHLTAFLASPQQLAMQGDDFEVKAEAVHNLGLVLHELATNATKYGALSLPDGRLLIVWEITAAESESPRLTLTWRETGGPPVSPPSEKGFGSQIIERHAAAAFRGKVTLDYGANSFLWKLEAPLKSFVDDGNSDSAADPEL